MTENKNKATELAEAIATRMIHDLISNAGAVANAVELMEDFDASDLGEAKEILGRSAFVLTARLKFFRLLFGLGDKPFDLASTERVVRDYLATLGDISFSNPGGIAIGKAELAAVMVVAECIIRGGSVTLSTEESGAGGRTAAVCAGSEDRIAAARAAEFKRVLEGGGNGAEVSAQAAPALYLRFIHQNVSIIGKPFGIGIN